MEFWHSKPHHLSQVRAFAQLAEDYALDLEFPNKEKAPWHVRAVVGRYGTYPQTVQFWPHLMKAYWDTAHETAHGAKGIGDLIERAADHAYEADFAVLEDD